jgi:hypothetical protein
MTKTKAPKADKLLLALEEAVLAALHGEGKDRNDAINAGIKLAAIKHRIIAGDDDGDFFGDKE